MQAQLFLSPGCAFHLRSALRGWRLLFLIGAAFGSVLDAAAQSPQGEPVPDPFTAVCGPVIPFSPLNGISGAVNNVGAAATGQGGWLTVWVELVPGAIIQTLKARLLPAAFDSPPNSGPENWIGGAGPILTVSRTLRSGNFSVIPGPGGAWLTWAEADNLFCQWFDRQQNGPVGAPIRLDGAYAAPKYVAASAGDGISAWVISGGGYGSAYTCSVLGAGPAGAVLKSEFQLPWEIIPTVIPAASGGRCLVSSRADSVVDAKLHTAILDERGVVGEQQNPELPSGGEWLGATPVAGGFLGVWAQYFGGLDSVILFGRLLGGDGDWLPGSAFSVLGPLPGTSAELRIIPGSDAAVISSKGILKYLLEPGGKLSRLLESFSGSKTYSALGGAVDGNRVLSLGFPYQTRRVEVNRLYTDSSKPTINAVLSEGAGFQSAPSLAWSAQGLHVVAQVRWMDPAGTAEPVSGYSKRAHVEDGLPLRLENFSSPAQAWSGNVQLVAYRRAFLPADQSAEDDVMGALFSTGPDGVLSPMAAPFVIAGGVDSQRGVAVAAPASAGGPFLVAWREEGHNSSESGHYLASVRAAFVSPEGEVVPSGGWTVDTGVREVSAVAVSGNSMVWKAKQNLSVNALTEIRMASITPGGGPAFYRTLSPPEQEAVAPQILTQGSTFPLAAWRDKKSGRIFVRNPDSSSPVVPVSPPGQTAREPALALLPFGRVAVLWMETLPQAYYSKVHRIWLTTVNSSSQATKPVVVAAGLFDPDTLVAAGDGVGKIAVALQDREFATSGVRVLLVAPLISAQGGLTCIVSTLSTEISWDISDVFPSRADIMEFSADLLQWQTDPNFLPAAQNGRAVLFFDRSAGGPQRFYRLRAQLDSTP